MNPSHRRIKNIVRQIVGKYKTSCPFKIADELGIHVKYLPYNSIDGNYLRINDLQIITLNDKYKHHPMGKFVMAHELFHAIHHDGIIELYVNGYLTKQKKEREANQFATYLCLMDQSIEEETTTYEVLRENGIPIEMERFLK